jgi:putative aminopeptidase FrvX
VRYMHTPVEVASLEDIQGTAKVLQAFAAGLSEAL